ncbi:hypothetical protein [Herbidospora cretacea]|uniref:hypothetical protein n=1 Tax=Herbidospora cretacea TaxID=28444 RepID=UPI0012F82F62|nr:hypothetical protein [Herbidospora cretacea]
MTRPVPVMVGGDLLDRVERLHHVLVTFPGTRGGTTLSVALDPERTVVAGGTLHLEGSLTLDRRPVRCVADVDLTTGTGLGMVA